MILTDWGKIASRDFDSPSGCPGPGEWVALALGEQTASQSEWLLAHARGCRTCAWRHRQAVLALSKPPSPEETLELEAPAPRTVRLLAAQLAATPVDRSRRSRWRVALPRLLPAPLGISLAFAAVLAMAAGTAFWVLRGNRPETLLAQAYTSSRTMELRIPGARYSEQTPASHTRGGSRDDEPAELLEARHRLAQLLHKQPQDARLLELKARAEVLEENYEDAVETLERLLALGPPTADLLSDTGIARFQRGLAHGNEADRVAALDYLRRAEEMAPDDSVVLFNEAIVMEDRNQWSNAVETWKRYLTVEKDPRWQKEGRARLAALRATIDRIESHQSRMDMMLATPEAMLGLAADPSRLAAYDEELSSVQLAILLGKAFPRPAEQPRGSPCPSAHPAQCLAARDLLRALADSLIRNHQDPWLRDLLAPSSAPPASKPSEESLYDSAIQALGAAIDLNSRGDVAGGLSSARVAMSGFAALHNPAGERRAVVAALYAMQRAFDFQACNRLYREWSPRLENEDYPWIRIQGAMIGSICFQGTEAETSMVDAIRKAGSAAADSRYAILGLRAMQLLSAAAFEVGDAEESWRLSSQGLRFYRSGDYPPMRLYAILSSQALVADPSPWRRFVYLSHREVLWVAGQTGSPIARVTEGFNFVNAAIPIGAIDEARQELRRSEDALSSLPDQPFVRALLAESEARLSAIDLARGDRSNAESLLRQAEGNLADSASVYDKESCAVVRAELDMANNHAGEAESGLRRILLADEAIFRKPKAAKATAPDSATPAGYGDKAHDLYAELAAIWLAQGRPPTQILALWERYRLRLIGRPIAPCPRDALDCLAPRIEALLAQPMPGAPVILGQIVLQNRVLVYRAGPTGVRWEQRTALRDDVLSAMRNLNTEVSSPSTSEESIRVEGERLAGQLLGSFPNQIPSQPGPSQATDNWLSAPSGQLPGKTLPALLLEPDPQLDNLPWPALYTSVGPLGLRYALSESPSFLLATEKSADLPARTQPRYGALDAGGLVIGASMANDEPPLPEVVTEARIVAGYAAKPNLLVADQATESRVIAKLENAPLVHFAGHAVNLGGGARLLLANPNHADSAPWVDSDLLRKHPPRACRLAVLSACASGRREEYWNHDMSDLVDTLGSLGVPEVIATRWRIDSSASATLMASFYASLAKGNSAADSLAYARMLVENNRKYRHPYYWASYYVSAIGSAGLGSYGIGRAAPAPANTSPSLPESTPIETNHS